MALQRFSPQEERLSAGSQAQFQEKARTFANLSDKLGQWEDVAYKKAASIRQKEGKEQAVIDVAKGEFKTTGDFTIYDKAYKDAGRTAYAIKTDQDAKQYAEYLKVKLDADAETKDNPEAYLKSYDKYMNTVTAEAPDEYTKAVIQQSMQKYGMAQYNTIVKAQIEKTEKYNEEAYSSGVKLYTEEFKEAVMSKDEEQIAEAQSKLMSVYNSGVTNKYISEEGAKLELKNLGKEIYKDTTLDEFKNSKNRLKYIDKFRDNNKLSEEDTLKMVTTMQKMMDSEYKDDKVAAAKRAAANANFKKRIKRNLKIKLLNGELTKEDLDNALKYDAIGLSDYDNYLNRSKTPGVTKDDDSTFNYYMKNMDNIDEDDILNDTNLTRSSKNTLISRKEKLDNISNDEAEEMMDWEGSSRGKQGKKEIRLHFKIVDGTIMSKMDFDNDNMKDFALINQLQYDEINALPVEERITKSLEVSRRLLKDYQNGEIINTKPYRDKQEEEKNKYIEGTGAISKEDFDKMKDTVKGGKRYKSFLDAALGF